MRIHLNERFENNTNKEISCAEEKDLGDLKQKCDKTIQKWKQQETKTLSQEDLFEKKINESEMAKKKNSENRKNIFFSGKVDANGDYGQGGGNQYFIQNAKVLKEHGNLIPVGIERCKFTPETDVYSSDIRESKEGYPIHLEKQPLMKEDMTQLDKSTSCDLKPESTEAENFAEEWDAELSEEELKYLDENTPSTECMRIVSPGEKEEDRFRPFGNQEDSNGKNHPDGWSNPKGLKDGDVYYQLIPGTGDGKNIYSSYFTDKETIDSCRDENGDIVLPALIQKLQIEPKVKVQPEVSGTIHKEYVEEYSVVQYKFKENPEEC